LGGFVHTLTAHAGDWILAPGITVEQVFTNNAKLNDEMLYDSITNIVPRISAHREGSRAKLDLRFAPQYHYYWHQTEPDEWVNYLRADGEVELYQDHLFVDGWASANQHTIVSGGRTGIDNLTGTGDLTEVYDGGFSPYYTTRLGPYLAGEARYTLDRVYYAEKGLDSSTKQRLDLVLGSGPSVRALPWQLHLEDSLVNYDDLEDNDRIRRLLGEVNYQLNRRWALAGTLGYEDYDMAVNSDRAGNLWGVGFVYTPSTRIHLALGAGERFYGTDYSLDFSLRGKRVVWTANYGQDVTSARDEIEAQNTGLFARQDEFGNLIRDPVLDSPIIPGYSGASLNAEYYLLDRFNTAFSFSTERTTLSLSAAYYQRDYEQDSPTPDTQETNLAAAVNRQLRQRIRGFVRLTWNDHVEELNDYQQWIASLGGSYILGEHTSLNLRLSHLDRNGDLDLNSYTEDQFSVALQASW
jgi:uncharacterized protein (PEP-CTERM system associated)